MIISVPPAMRNQVFTSALLTTSPRRIASSSRFGVGSSVRSLASRSSAMEERSAVRHERVHHAAGVIEEEAHHGAEYQHQEEKAEQDRQRQRDEEYLHLRHEPRQHAESDVEQKPEDQE